MYLKIEKYVMYRIRNCYQEATQYIKKVTIHQSFSPCSNRSRLQDSQKLTKRGVYKMCMAGEVSTFKINQGMMAVLGYNK